MHVIAPKNGGFSLLETAIALVIMMIIGLGIASLFAYATQANTRADDRELAMTIAQKRTGVAPHHPIHHANT